MISYTIKFHCKNFLNSCNPGESCFKFWMKCLNYLNFVTHTFLTGWYLFIFFPVAPFWCTPSVILDLCFVLLTTNTAIWANLVGAHRSKLEVKHFIFHVVVFSRETLAWKFLLCVPQKVFRVYFSKFCSCVVHSCSKIT